MRLVPGNGAQHAHIAAYRQMLLANVIAHECLVDERLLAVGTIEARLARRLGGNRRRGECWTAMVHMAIVVGAGRYCRRGVSCIR